MEKVRVLGDIGLQHLHTVPAHLGYARIELLIGLLLQGVDAGVFAVYIQYAIDAALVYHLVGGLGAELLAQFISYDGYGEILAGAQQEVGKLRHPAVIDVIVQRALAIGTPEAHRHILLRQHQAGLPVHGYAAAYGKAAVLFVKGQAAGQLHALLLGVIHGVELGGAVRQQAQHRQTVVLVNYKAEAQCPAGQGAFLKVHGPYHRGAVYVYGAGVLLALRRGGRAVQSIAYGSGGAELHVHAVNIVIDPVRRQTLRL